MDEDLTKKEKFLLEEYKIGMDAYYRSEAIYATRENFFFVAMGIIVAAAVNIVVTPVKLLSDLNSAYYYILLISLIFLLGIILSAIWYNIQEKSSYLSYKRMERLKQIENEIPSSPPQNHEKIFKFFTITNSEDKDTRYMETWALRKRIPITFLISFSIFWIFTLIYWLFWVIIKVACQYKQVV